MIDLPDLANNFGTTDRLAYNFLNTPRKQAEELVRKVSEFHRHDYGGDPLNFVYYLASFKGTDGGAEVDVAYSVPSVQLGNVEDGLGERTWLSGRVALQDMDFNFVQGLPFKMGPLRRPVSEQENLQLSTGAFRFSAQPGEYRSAVSLRDSISQKYGIFTSPLQISDYSANRILLSDIKLAASIVPHRWNGIARSQRPFHHPSPGTHLFPRDAGVLLLRDLQPGTQCRRPD